LCVLDGLLGIRKGTRSILSLVVKIAVEGVAVSPVSRHGGEAVEVTNLVWAVVDEVLLLLLG